MSVSTSFKRGADFLSQVIDEFFKTGKDDVLDVAVYYLVMGLAAIGAAIAASVIGVAAYFLLEIVAGTEIGIIAGAVLFFAVLILGIAIAYTPSLSAIEFIYTNKKVAYFDPANRNVAIKWVLFMVGVFVLLMLLMAIPMVGMGAGGVAGLAFMPLYLLLLIPLFLAAFILSIMFYYVNQELAINKRGPIEALRASYKIVKNNFWETILVAVVLWVVSQGLSAVLGVMLQVFVIVAMVFWPLLLIIILLAMVASLIIGAAETIVKVKFYKKLVEKKTVAKKKTAA